MSNPYQGTGQPSLAQESLEAERITAEAAVELTHPEHATITLEPGTYEVRMQREYTEAGGISLVAD